MHNLMFLNLPPLWQSRFRHLSCHHSSCLLDFCPSVSSKTAPTRPCYRLAQAKSPCSPPCCPGCWLSTLSAESHTPWVKDGTLPLSLPFTITSFVSLLHQGCSSTAGPERKPEQTTQLQEMKANLETVANFNLDQFCTQVHLLAAQENIVPDIKTQMPLQNFRRGNKGWLNSISSSKVSINVQYDQDKTWIVSAVFQGGQLWARAECFHVHKDMKIVRARKHRSF